MYTTQQILNRVLTENDNAIRVVIAENDALYATQPEPGDIYLQVEGDE